MKEKDQLNNCLYCGNELIQKRWLSNFYDNFHYKITKCDCGKISSIREKILLSSGHDNWDGNWISLSQLKKIKNQIKNLENKIN